MPRHSKRKALIALTFAAGLAGASARGADCEAIVDRHMVGEA